jgi:hypothetical protein
MLELLRGISRYVCGWVRTRRLRCRAPTHHWGPSAVGCYWADLLNSSEVFDLEEARVQKEHVVVLSWCYWTMEELVLTEATLGLELKLCTQLVCFEKTTITF